MSGFEDEPSLFAEKNAFEMDLDETPIDTFETPKDFNLRSIESENHFELENSVETINNENMFEGVLTEEEANQFTKKESKKTLKETSTASTVFDISFTGSIFNLLTSTLPVGLLLVPFLFKSCGIFGGLLWLLFGALFTSFSLFILSSRNNF
jgi:hypothetical protein